MNLDIDNAALLAIAFFCPGFVWSATISMFVPRRTKSEQLRLIEFATFSSFNYAFWSWLIIILLSGKTYETNPVLFGFYVFGILFASPVLFGLLVAGLQKTKAVAWFLSRFGLHPINPIPTAWDYVFSQKRSYFAIVTFSDGRTVCGFFGGRSFAGDDPDERDLYMETVFHVADAGNWVPREKSGGIIIKATQIASIEFVTFMEKNDGPDSSGPTKINRTGLSAKTPAG